MKQMTITFKGTMAQMTKTNLQPEDMYHCLCLMLKNIEPTLAEGYTLETCCEAAIKEVRKRQEEESKSQAAPVNKDAGQKINQKLN